MLHQDDNMTHSWFVNFHKNFNAHLPLWFSFSRWWTQFGPVIEIFPRPLIGSFKYFSNVLKVDSHGTKFLASLHFVKKYKVPWVLKWQYVKEGDLLTRRWYVKWWDKFSHTQNVIDNVTREFSTTNEVSYPKAQSPMQPAVPQITVTAPATSFTKSSAKAKKKKSPLDDLSKDALYALLKQKWKGEQEAENATSEEENSQASSEASVTANNPYYPYNQELFGHDKDSTPDLGENQHYQHKQPKLPQ